MQVGQYFATVERDPPELDSSMTLDHVFLTLRWEASRSARAQACPGPSRHALRSVRPGGPSAGIRDRRILTSETRTAGR